MKVKDIMTKSVIHIRPEESVSVAARTLTHYNIGALPVCGGDGRVCGIVTDRDIVTRCLSANRMPEETRVRDVMTAQVVYAQPDMDAGVAAGMMGKRQIRRLPVVEGGKLCGMLSLGDLAQCEESVYDASDALNEITSNISDR